MTVSLFDYYSVWLREQGLQVWVRGAGKYCQASSSLPDVAAVGRGRTHGARSETKPLTSCDSFGIRGFVKMQFKV